MGFWTLLEGLLPLANAFAVLNENRFLVARGWSFEEYSRVRKNSAEGQAIGLIYAHSIHAISTYSYQCSCHPCAAGVGMIVVGTRVLVFLVFGLVVKICLLRFVRRFCTLLLNLQRIKTLSESWDFVIALLFVIWSQTERRSDIKERCIFNQFTCIGICKLETRILFYLVFVKCVRPRLIRGIVYICCC